MDNNTYLSWMQPICNWHLQTQNQVIDRDCRELNKFLQPFFSKIQARYTILLCLNVVNLTIMVLISFPFTDLDFPILCALSIQQSGTATFKFCNIFLTFSNDSSPDSSLLFDSSIPSIRIQKRRLYCSCTSARSVKWFTRLSIIAFFPAKTSIFWLCNLIVPWSFSMHALVAILASIPAKITLTYSWYLVILNSIEAYLQNTEIGI